jgi:hypothetical protein
MIEWLLVVVISLLKDKFESQREFITIQIETIGELK